MSYIRDITRDLVYDPENDIYIVVEPLTDITLDVDRDAGSLIESVEYYFNAGYVNQNLEGSYDLGVAVITTVYTQTNAPREDDPIFRKEGTTVSWVNSYNSDNSSVTAMFDPNSPYTRNLDDTKMWDKENNRYVDYHTLTIDPDPADALVVLGAAGYIQSGNSIVVPEGTHVSITVTKSGYYDEATSIILNSNQILHIALTEIPYSAGQVIFESSTPGTYSFTPEVSGKYAVEAVAGGGGGAAAAKDHAYSSSTSLGGFTIKTIHASAVAGGGSGNVYTGILDLVAGSTYSVTIGSGGTGANEGSQYGGTISKTAGSGTATSIGNLVSVTGGTGGYAYASISGDNSSASATAGTGFNSGTRDSRQQSASTSVNSNYSISATGGAGYNGHGTGGNASKWNNHDTSSSAGGSGYVKITFSSVA